MKRFDKKDEGYKTLAEAFRLSNADFVSGAELVPESEVRFADDYDERLMRRIKENKRRRMNRLLYSSALRRAAVFVFSAILVFALSVSVEAIRAPVFGFIENVYDSIVEFIVESGFNGPETIEKTYTLGGIPEGFESLSVHSSPTDVTTKWSDGQAVIELEQRTIDAKAVHDIYKAEKLKTERGGIEYIYICSFNFTSLLWHNGEYFFVINWYDNISVYEMIELAESISI